MEDSKYADKAQIPPYPDQVKSVKVEVQQDLTAVPRGHGSSQLNAIRNEKISDSLNVHHGSFEFGRNMDAEDIVHIDLNRYSASYRSDKNDNTNFNLYDRHNYLCLHISFRRHDSTIRFNHYSDGRWGDETVVEFPDIIKNERSCTLSIRYYGPRENAYSVYFGTACCSDIPGCGNGPNSLTYRSGTSDPMFGESVNADVTFR